MNQIAIEAKDLSKVYRISHERRGIKGTQTLRDTIVEMTRKPVELVTGRQLRKEEFWALKDVNFNVNHGDVLGIIGKNGSGKSTLLKILSRIVDPTTGEIRMRGRVASLLEVGTGFHPELTGRENILFNGSILGMKRKEIISKFDEIVAFSEVEQFLDTPVKFYSSGMYVRLAFAVAAHLDPDILIVDEVLAVGDAAFQKKSLGKMKSVADSGRTVLFVSHNMETVRQLCNRVILLEKGRIKNEGSPAEITNEYAGRLQKSQGTYKFATDNKKAAQFTQIKIKDSADKVSTTIPAGTDWTLSLDYRIRENMKDTIVAVEIQSDEYETIYWTSDVDQVNEIRPRQAGLYLAELKFDKFHLIPGNYFLRVSIQSPGRQMYDEITDLLLTVEPDADDIRGAYFGGRYYGFIHEKVNWQITKQISKDL